MNICNEVGFHTVILHWAANVTEKKETTSGSSNCFGFRMVSKFQISNLPPFPHKRSSITKQIHQWKNQIISRPLESSEGLF